MFIFMPLWAHVPIRQQPWANYALIAVTILVSWWCVAFEEDALALAGFEEAPVPGLTLYETRRAVELGWRPNFRRTLPAPVSALTSTFVHGGVIHLLGNMMFLWIFGNAVNQRLGHGRFLGLYALSALMAGTLHAVMRGDPVIGASGAINGVVAAFLVLFPRKKISVFMWIFLPGLWRSPRTVPVTGIVMIPFWLFWDLLMLLAGQETGVAHWAHLGGFVTGFVLTLFVLATGWVKAREGEETLLEVFGVGR